MMKYINLNGSVFIAITIVFLGIFNSSVLGKVSVYEVTSNNSNSDVNNQTLDVRPATRYGIDNNIPVTTPMGRYLIDKYGDNAKLNDKELIDAFLHVDERKGENDPAYALIYSEMNKIDSTTGRETLGNIAYKGSGTVLYRADEHILVLTAWHNILGGGVSPDRKVSSMYLLMDNKAKKAKNTVSAKMVDDNYVKIASKDVALVVMKLTDYTLNLYENKKANFNILDFKNTVLKEGEENCVTATIRHYPDILDYYVQNSGLIYHKDGVGHHTIPALHGSSGASVIVNKNDIVGVYHQSGDSLSVKEMIFYGKYNILTDRVNYFELITLDDIKDVVNHKGMSKNRKTPDLLINITKRYINAVEAYRKTKDTTKNVMPVYCMP